MDRLTWASPSAWFKWLNEYITRLTTRLRMLHRWPPFHLLLLRPGKRKWTHPLWSLCSSFVMEMTNRSLECSLSQPRNVRDIWQESRDSSCELIHLFDVLVYRHWSAQVANQVLSALITSIFLWRHPAHVQMLACQQVYGLWRRAFFK